MTLLGFLGQGLFTVRIVTQWWASERAGKSVVPPSFWWFSVGGTLMLAFYAWATKDPVFILGPTVNLFIYVRNLMLVRGKSGSRPTALIIPLLLVIVTSASVAGYFSAQDKQLLELAPTPFWAVLGMLGTLLWVTRFPVQWFVSERRGKSVLPASFWWISAIGAGLLASYAGFARAHPDWVFVLAYSFLPIPAIRNLMLIYRTPASKPETVSKDTGSIRTTEAA
ncbi:MAG: lipid-A-disaccharide synthase N-terminal domain-containing protein [Planctomycetota bacterium]